MKMSVSRLVPSQVPFAKPKPYWSTFDKWLLFFQHQHRQEMQYYNSSNFSLSYTTLVEDRNYYRGITEKDIQELNISITITKYRSNSISRVFFFKDLIRYLWTETFFSDSDFLQSKRRHIRSINYVYWRILHQNVIRSINTPVH